MDITMRYILAFAPDIIQMVVAVIFGCLGIAVKQLTKRYLDNDTKRTIVKDIVQAVEQIYTDLHGQDKFNAAAEAFRQELDWYGITITEQEMQVLIESAVNEFNRKRNED